MVRISGGDGSSFENAIIISHCNNSEGVKQEYIELRKRFGIYKLIIQHLLNNEGKMYDKLEIEINNEKLEVYFDISAFFYAWE